MVTIEINGQHVQVKPGVTVIEAADDCGIHIPRFCYHKKLSVAANCRMCLIEVEKAGKPLPACATPVTEGMKVWTQSAVVRESQQAVMEFLLVNHPLDCPICDQGGQCELQDVALQYGEDTSRFTEQKRVVPEKDIGPLVATELTRCIHCTRCVRFGQEVAGVRELGMTGRGEHSEIGTFLQHLESEVSGNVIDLCPVGALTAKPSRYQARPWELQEGYGISPHDCLGTHLTLHHVRQQVMRVVPREQEQINETWISDRDRYSYQGLTVDRLQAPQIKKNNVWYQVGWEEALAAVAAKLPRNPEHWGFLLSPQMTLEEGYLVQKLARSYDCPNIDYRLRQQDFSETEPASVELGITPTELEQQDFVFLIGSDIHREAPVLALRLRKPTVGQIATLSPLTCAHTFPVTLGLIAEQGDFLKPLLGIAKALVQLTKASLPAEQSRLLTGRSKAEHKKIAEALLAGRSSLLLGGYIAAHPQRRLIQAVARLISQLSEATYGMITDGSNAVGLGLVGCVPHCLPGGHMAPTIGKNAEEIWQSCQNYFLFGFDPSVDIRSTPQGLAGLKAAQQVIACTAYDSPCLREHAHILLPIAPPAENSGTYINCFGLWQSFDAAVPPLAEAKPTWKILRVIANLSQQPGFEYTQVSEIQTEIKAQLRMLEHPAEELWPEHLPTPGVLQKNEFIRLGPVALYSADDMVRRAAALQQTAIAQRDQKIGIHPHVGRQYKITAGMPLKVADKRQTATVILPTFFSKEIPENCVLLPLGIAATAPLGAAYETVYLSNV